MARGFEQRPEPTQWHDLKARLVVAKHIKQGMEAGFLDSYLEAMDQPRLLLSEFEQRRRSRLLRRLHYPLIAQKLRFGAADAPQGGYYLSRMDAARGQEITIIMSQPGDNNRNTRHIYSRLHICNVTYDERLSIISPAFSKQQAELVVEQAEELQALNVVDRGVKFVELD